MILLTKIKGRGLYSIYNAFEEERNGEKVSKIKLVYDDYGLKVEFDIYDNHYSSTFSNTLFINKRGEVKVILHDAYVGGGIEEIIENSIKLYFGYK